MNNGGIDKKNLETLLASIPVAQYKSKGDN